MEVYEFGYFIEENFVEVVIGWNKNVLDVWFKEVMEVFICKFYEVVKEIEFSQEEWFQVIQFLIKIGYKCDDWCQEFILLFDVFGVFMLVDVVNFCWFSGVLENIVFGLFYFGDVLEYEMGYNICFDEKGEDMLVWGKVIDVEGNLLEGVKIDVW